MFQLRRKRSGFQSRSPERDAALDNARAEHIIAAIAKAILEAENERDGLQRRLDDSIARSSVTVGNAADEYLSRDKLSDQHQQSLSDEIKYAETRLNVLARTIEFYMSSQALFRTAIR